MNIEAIRKVQASIADPYKFFDMRSWCHCIAGHAYRVEMGRWSTNGMWMQQAEFLGISYEESEDLFSAGANPTSREEAIAKLESLIQNNPSLANPQVLSRSVPDGTYNSEAAAAASPAAVPAEQEELVGV